MGEGARTRVLILLPADLTGQKIGGIQSFVRDFIKFAPADFEIEVLGASSDQQARPVGRWQDLDVDGRTIRHMAVTRVSPSHVRSRIPVALRYTAGLLRFRGRIPVSGRVRQFHRAGAPLAFLGRISPAIQIVHLNVADIYTEAGESRWRMVPGLYHLVEDITIRRMDRVFVVNEAGVRFYQGRHPAIAQRVQFTPTWFDDTIFAPRQAAERAALRGELLRDLEVDEAGDKLVLFVGRLERQKHPELLIDTLAALGDQPRARLLIVGDGGLRKQTERRAAERGLTERIHFLGWRPRHEIAQLMGASDALLLPSRFEGMPITVLEALACGLPVAATAVGEVPRVVQDGVSGWLAQSRTPAAMAEALRRVLQAGRPGLSDGARAAAAPYSSSVVLGALYEAHREVLALAR